MLLSGPEAAGHSNHEALAFALQDCTGCALECTWPWDKTWCTVLKPNTHHKRHRATHHDMSWARRVKHSGHSKCHAQQTWKFQ